MTTTTVPPFAGTPDFGAPPAPSSTTRQAAPKAPVSTSRYADQPLGIPTKAVQNPDGSISYVSDWVPPQWVAGQGPMTVGDTSGALGGGHPNAAGTTSVSSAMPNQGDWYRTNDAWEPARQPEQIPAIKQQLVQAGLLTAQDVAAEAGLWTQADAQAYEVVLGQANTYGVNASQMLSWRAQHPGTPTIQYSNPADVDALARQVIAPAIGRDLTTDELSKFESAYRKWETSNATQSQEAAQSGSTMTTAAENPSSFVAQYGRENFGGAESGVRMADLLTHVDSMLKGG